MTTARRQVRRTGRRSAWIAGLSVLVLVAAGGAYWFKQRGAADAAASEPTTATVSLGAYRVSVAGPGTLAAAESFAVTTDIAGTVSSIAAVGERVLAGDVVAQLDTAPFERAVSDAALALQKAQAQVSSLSANQASSSGSLSQTVANAEATLAGAQRALVSAETDLALARQLYGIGSESQESVNTAQESYDSALEASQSAQRNLDTLRASQGYQATSDEGDLQNAQLAVEQARLGLEDTQDDLAATTIRSPFDGVIVSVDVPEGNKVFAEGTLLTLIDDTSVELGAQVDETEIGQVDLGQSADVTLDAFPDETFTGTVTAISPEATLESNIPIFGVTITLENADLSLRPGMTAEAEIVVREIENAATLPLAALQSAPARPAGGRPNGRGTAQASLAPAPSADTAAEPDETASAAPTDAAPGSFRNRAATELSLGEDFDPADLRIVQIEGEDGSYQSVPVRLIDTTGLNAVVMGNLSDGDVVLVPDSSTTSSNDTFRGPSGFPLGGGGPPSGGRSFGGGRP